MENVCAVILAAGDGKRMKSKEPKVLCEVLFKPMISWVLSACEEAGIKELCAVVAPSSHAVEALLPEGCGIAIQSERLGTGHAVMAAAEFLEKNYEKSVLLLYGDTPFVDAETIKAAYSSHVEQSNDVTVVTAKLDNPNGYGRIIRNGEKFAGIVEQRDADEKTLAIHEINSGIYWFRCGFLLDALQELSPANAQGEYYITDTVAIAVENGCKTGVYTAAPTVVMGANDRQALAELNQRARELVLQKHYRNGVNIPITDGVVIGAEAVIGEDTLILAGTVIKGKTVIGEGCTIGPVTMLTDCVVHDSAHVEYTVAENAEIGKGAKIGPFTRLRPNTKIGARAKVGNFVEIKNSNIGERTSVAHLSYLGDSDVGEQANIGCGVVTANYDGEKKHRTQIGSGAFIGCNTNFIAPVSVGEDCIIGAGTTVTEDVPEGALSVGRAVQVTKADWARHNGKYKRK